MPYGDTRNDSTDEAYRFGCGNCHPIDGAKHMDGTVQVELYDANSPAGSLKAKNPAGAAYDEDAKTCSDVYCHSGYTVTSSAVSAPLARPPSPAPPGYPVGYAINTASPYYVMDDTCSELTYAPYTVTPARAYATTPAWGTTGTFDTCEECHAFPLTTYWPDVDAMAGDSHQWVDDSEIYWGSAYNWGHAYNMGFDPLPCRTCHYSTVTQVGSTSYVYPKTVYDPVAISGHAAHVNGTADVAFDTVNGFTYRNAYSLAGASYDPPTKTCSNVPCHYNPSGPGATRWQQYATWGEPWRYWDPNRWTWVGCEICHRAYGNLNTTCNPAP